MKKNVKYLIIVLFLLIILLIFFYVFFISKNNIDTTITNNNVVQADTTKIENYDPSVMTGEERKALRVNPAIKVEVLRRSATGTPSEYRIIP